MCIDILRLALGAPSAAPNSPTSEPAHPSIDSPTSPHTQQSIRAPSGFPLTVDEDRVMACLAEGLLYKEIAERLRFSETKVKRLQHWAYEALGTHKAVQAVDKWREIKRQQGGDHWTQH